MENYSLNSCGHIRELTKNSKQKLGFIGWNYTRAFRNGKRAVLSDQEGFIQIMYPKAPGKNIIPVNNNLLSQTFNITDQMMENHPNQKIHRPFIKLRSTERQLLNAQHSFLYRYKEHPEYIDTIELHYSSDRTFYKLFNQLDYLSTEADKFLDNARDLLAIAEENSLTAKLPQVKRSASGKPYVMNQSITRRELDCINLLLRNRTSREIANTLNLSIRTVEGYMDNLKLKLNVSHKQELSDLFIQNGLYPQLLSPSNAFARK